MHNYHITYLERSYLQSLLCVGCNGAWILGDYVSGTGALQRSETVAPTRGLQRSMDNMQRKCTRPRNTPELYVA